MQSTIFASAAGHVDAAADSAADEILEKLRSPLLQLIKVILWMASAATALAAITLYLVSQAVLGFALIFQRSEPQRSQPTPNLLPPAPAKHYPQCELAECPDVLITPVPQSLVLEAISAKLYCQQTPTWQQWVIAQIQEQPKIVTEIQVASNPLNNQLALIAVCWQAFAQTAEALKPVKASELKEVASDLKIKGYRKMNKSELLVALAASAASAA